MTCAWRNFDVPDGMSFFINQCAILNQRRSCWILDLTFGQGVGLRWRRKQGVRIVKVGLPGRLKGIMVGRGQRVDLGSVLEALILNLLNQPVIIQSALKKDGVANRLRVPAVVIEHFSGFENGVSYPALNPGIPVLAVSPGLAEKIVAQLGRPVNVVGNPIPSRFLGSSILRAPSHEGIRFILFARNVAVKNLEASLEAITEVLSVRTAWSFTVVSDSLPSDVVGHDRLNFLPLYGKLSSEQVREMMLQSDLICSFSKTETFGLTIAEALSLGRPVLATPTSGGRLLVQHGVNGFLADGFSSTDIVSVLENAEKAMLLPKKGIRESITRFREDNWSKAVLDALDDSVRHSR